MEKKEVCFSDVYVVPPGRKGELESYIRFRHEDGQYSVDFEEWVIQTPFIISPGASRLKASPNVLYGLLSMGYELVALLERKRKVFWDPKVSVKLEECVDKFDWEKVQIEGKDKKEVREVTKVLMGYSRLSNPPVTTYTERALSKELSELLLPEFLIRDLSLKGKQTLSSASKEIRRRYLASLNDSNNRICFT